MDWVKEGCMYWKVCPTSAFCSYWTGDDADIFGILFEPVVHVFTDSKQVVKAGSLTRRPVAFWHLEDEQEKENHQDKGKKVKFRWIIRQKNPKTHKL